MLMPLFSCPSRCCLAACVVVAVLASGSVQSAAAELVLLDDFETQATASIDGQASGGVWQYHGGTWTTSNRNTGGVRVMADPTAEGNQVVAVNGLKDGSDDRTGGLGRDSRSTGAESRIAADEVGTLFLRFFARGDNPNTFVGISARDVAQRGVTPDTDREAIEVGFGLKASSESNAGQVDVVSLDGGTVFATVPADTWHHAWIVVRRDAEAEAGAGDTFDLYVNTGGSPLETHRVVEAQPLHQPGGYGFKSVLLVGEDGVPDRTAMLLDDLFWNGDAEALIDPLAAEPQ
jgi:hypothetical protein